MKKLTQQQFIAKAKEIHGDKYDYSKVNYINMRTKVTITCPIHGDFEMLPGSHINQKQGCRECKRYSRLDKVRLTNEEFIEKAKTVHGDKYNYNKVEYTLSKNKIIITCPKHGDFKQTANSHLMGAGCMKCGDEERENKMKYHPRGWSYSNWEKRGNKSKNFDSFKVYIIKCWNDEEEFYKIGKTFRKLSERFSNNSVLPYNYEVVKVFKGEAEEMSKLESKIQSNNRKNKYKPKIKFFGLQECFLKIEL